MNKVSIIIPTFNGQEFLRDTIESTLNQTYKNIEVFVIDDCSTDSTLSVLSSYEGRIQLIKNDKNLGLAKTVNKAVSLTDSDYLILLGQDDLLPYNHVEIMVKQIQKNDDVALVHCNSLRIDSNGDELGFTFKNKAQIKKSKNPLYYLSINNFIQSCGLIFDREKFIEVNGWNEKYKLYGEWLIFIKLASKWKILYNDKTYGFYRIHANSTMRKINNEQRGEVALYYEECRDLAIFNYGKPNIYLKTIIIFQKLKTSLKQVIFFSPIKKSIKH